MSDHYRGAVNAVARPAALPIGAVAAMIDTAAFIAAAPRAIAPPAQRPDAAHREDG
jgi:hypothetical protein